MKLWTQCYFGFRVLRVRARYAAAYLGCVLRYRARRWALLTRYLASDLLIALSMREG